ncbi:hypothetical protein CFAEC_12325 [Corynebacterium faecale]|nr:hypothetical protein CFAEC_12325 [Corynebacterium faecale]
MLRPLPEQEWNLVLVARCLEPLRWEPRGRHLVQVLPCRELLRWEPRGRHLVQVLPCRELLRWEPRGRHLVQVLPCRELLRWEPRGRHLVLVARCLEPLRLEPALLVLLQGRRLELGSLSLGRMAWWSPVRAPLNPRAAWSRRGLPGRRFQELE